MALTQDQWFKKLKELIPSWVFEREEYNEAIFKGLAKILEQGHANFEAHLNETFIDSAEDDFLDIHAAERSVERLPGDTTSTYRTKIKSILNNSDCTSLKELVDSLLIRGESTFIENHKANNFFNREAFLNRNIIDVSIIYNAFSVLIDYQIPLPTSFFDRESFADRESVYGSALSLDVIFENVIETINKNKALGTVYRLIERGATA